MKAMKSTRMQTTVFKSGNSQAVRIPAQFRFESGSVIIERVPEGLLLRAVEEKFDEVEDLPIDPVPEIDGPAEKRR